MARYRIRGHVLPHLGYGEGRFEGVGWGSHPNCSTCVGSGRVLGDAVAKSGNTYYRARIYERSVQRVYRYRARRWWRR